MIDWTHPARVEALAAVYQRVCSGHPLDEQWHTHWRGLHPQTRAYHLRVGRIIAERAQALALPDAAALATAAAGAIWTRLRAETVNGTPWTAMSAATAELHAHHLRTALAAAEQVTIIEPVLCPLPQALFSPRARRVASGR